jgi:hypothetical protein
VAKNYTTVSSYQTVQVLTQTTSADVQAVTIVTKPSGIYTVVLVPIAQWQGGNADAYLNPPAELLEQLIAGGLVTGAVYVQSTDSSDLLAGFMQLTVSYTPPSGLAQPFTTKVMMPMTAIVSLDAFGAYSTSDDGDDPIRVAWNQLKATAAL